MDAMTYSTARANLASIMDRVCNDHAPLIITRNGGQSVVMLSLADFNAIEETAYLLLYGALPTAGELGAFDAALKAARQLPAPVLDIIAAVKTAHPMDALRTAVSALAAFEPAVTDNGREATLAKGVRLIAQVPMIVAAHARLRAGEAPLASDPSLGHAANFLWLITGQKPSADAAKLLDMSVRTLRNKLSEYALEERSETAEGDQAESDCVSQEA